MKPKYYILSGDTVPGFVYEKNGNFFVIWHGDFIDGVSNVLSIVDTDAKTVSTIDLKEVLMDHLQKVFIDN